jgi:hypothetical protein
VLLKRILQDSIESIRDRRVERALGEIVSRRADPLIVIRKVEQESTREVFLQLRTVDERVRRRIRLYNKAVGDLVLTSG